MARSISPLEKAASPSTKASSAGVRLPDPAIPAISTARVTALERERARTLRVERGDQDQQEQQQQQQQQQQQRGPGGQQVEPKWLSDTSDKLYFSRTSRDMRRVDICVADTATGEVKTLIEERLNTYVETKPLWLVNNGQELIHWSERDGWGHYYLFDGGGALKNQITSGEFYCDAIEGVDEKTRTIFLTAIGREAGEDPYYDHLYCVGFDGGGLKLLNPGDSSHAAQASDTGKYFVDNYSRVNCEPKSTLYDQLGSVVMETATCAITGWPTRRPPSSNWPAAIRSSTLTASASTAIRAAVLCRPPRC